MNEQVSVSFPDGPRVITMSVGTDGAVNVEVANRVGRLIKRATTQLEADHTRDIVTSMLLASQLPTPPGHLVLVNLYDKPDPEYGETTEVSVWQPIRDLAAETLRHGESARIGPGEYTALTFLKWSAIFAAGLAGSFLFLDLVAQYRVGVHLADVVAIDPSAKLANMARRPITIAAGFLLLFVYGVLAQRFTDTYRSDGHPIWPALVGTLPFALAAYAIGGGAGLFQLFTVVVLPLALVAFGLGILNPGGRTDRELSFFNWRGWY